ncbi:hypothetical protein Hanom_Chr01g00084321 [Helianthus anomalus]
MLLRLVIGLRIAVVFLVVRRIVGVVLLVVAFVLLVVVLVAADVESVADLVDDSGHFDCLCEKIGVKLV